MPNRVRSLVGRLARRFAAFVDTSDKPVDPGSEVGPNDRYLETPPSVANAVNVFAGEWSTKLPIDTPTGFADLFDDHRVTSCVAALGGVDGSRVLELGPLEGAHTATLRALGAASVEAIEANTGAYLRCLVTKEVLGLDGVSFRLGDFRPFLANTDERYDLAVAIGVLYHLDDPVPVLTDLARVTDRIVVWTHVYNDEFGMERLADRFDPVEHHTVGSTAYRLHPYRYESSLDWSGFSGGTRPVARWIERDDLLDVIDALGFDIVTRDDHDHPHGPAVTMALQRRPR